MVCGHFGFKIYTAHFRFTLHLPFDTSMVWIRWGCLELPHIVMDLEWIAITLIQNPFWVEPLGSFELYISTRWSLGMLQI